MGSKYLISVDFVDASRLDPAGAGKLVETSAWIADEPADSDAMAVRNQAIADALIGRLPSLSAQPDRTSLVYDTMEDAVPPEAMIRRFHRARILSGLVDNQAVEVTLLDHVARVTVGVDPASDIAPALSQLFTLVHTLTGYAPVLPWTGHATTPIDAAAALLDRNRLHLDRLRRQTRREALLARFGVPSVVLTTLLAWLVAGWIGTEAFRIGREYAATDITRPMTFVTLAIPPAPTILGLFPDYALDGVIAETGQTVRVKVFREQVIRAGYQARFAVLPTSLPERPFVLQSIHDNAGPVVTVGSESIAWFGALALLPLGLWGWLVIRPWWTVAPEARQALRVQTARMTIWGVQIALAIMAIALIKLYV